VSDSVLRKDFFQQTVSLNLKFEKRKENCSNDLKLQPLPKQKSPRWEENG